MLIVFEKLFFVYPDLTWMYAQTQCGCTSTLLSDVHPYCYRMYKLYRTRCTKKGLSKPINMGSSFEDLDARNSKVKMVRNLDKRFSRYFFFKFWFSKIKGKNCSPVSRIPFSLILSTFNLVVTLGEHACNCWYRTKQKATLVTTRWSVGFPSQRQPFF